MEPPPADLPPIQELSSRQRRVVGVLVEKAFTTPDAYPLTLKALTTGCNQKSNRDPVTNYSEDDVIDVLDELRELGLIGTVLPDSGRTERYRHYMRQRFQFSERQLAIVTELLLRGAQKLGELRTRASRMRPIDSQDQLREELRGLQEQGYLQADGGLERRGTMVDHGLYRAKELPTLPGATQPSAVTPSSAGTNAPAANMGSTAAAAKSETFENVAVPAPATNASPATNMADVVTQAEFTRWQQSTWMATCQDLQAENRELREQLETVQQQLATLADEFERLRADLGG